MTIKCQKTMWTLALALLFSLCWNLVHAAAPATWVRENVMTQPYVMGVMARVHQDGNALKAPGAKIAVFYGDELRGVADYDDSDGLYFYNLTVAVAAVTETGYTFKYYSPANDAVYDLVLPAENDPLAFNALGYGGFFPPDYEFEPLVLTLKKYAITVVNGVADKAEAYEGETVTITAEDPAEHELFDEWTGDVEFADVNAVVTTFVMPAADVTVTATYKAEPKYAVSVVHGTADKTEAYAGEMITITADAPAEHELFDEWTGDVEFADVDAAVTTFVMLAADVTVTATYKAEPKYAVTVVNGAADKTEAYAGETVTITAEDPAEHELFDKWTGDVAFADANAVVTTFVMPANGVTVTAAYKAEPKYVVTVVNGTADKAEAYAGETVTVTADEPGEHKVFVAWTGDAEFADASAAGTSFTMPAHDVTVTAMYKDADKFAVIIVKGVADKAEAYAGETITITADAPAEHELFDKWTGEVAFADANAAVTTFVMPANDVMVTVTYKPEPKYAVTVVKGAADKMEAYAGEMVTVTAEAPAEHVLFDMWTGEVAFADADAAVTTFVMPVNDVTVTATYKPEPKYAVTVVKGTADKAEAYAGESIEITADEPEKGMNFVRWIAEGVAFADEQSPATSFTMPAADVTVTATYKKKPGYEEWPGDMDLYKPADGKMFREVQAFSVTFSWPVILNAAGYRLIIKTYGGDDVFDGEVEENACTVDSLELDSYVWNVTALDEDGGVLAAGTSQDFHFAVAEDNGVPLIKEAKTSGTAITLIYDTEEAGYREGIFAYQMFFYSLNARQWMSLTQNIQVVDGQAIVNLGVDASNGYLYICPITTPESNFVELYIK